ncbi:MAG: hypothetical protein WBQ44_08460 [Rhodococcus sp. (in: high G+C Gram-positive bacteria)]
MDFDDGHGGARGGDRGVDEAVAAALSYLDSVDPASAADAQAGWEGLRSVSPPGGPTQNSVQTFLWQHLRLLVDDADRARDVALALADLLDRLGHARYADIARSAQTLLLLQVDDEPARHRLYLDTVAGSGIGPEDTDLLTWQEIPEGTERAVADLIGETLEVATVAGEFAPRDMGGPPLRERAVVTKRRRITESVLRSERAGGVLLEQILDHRIALWTRYSPPRAELYRDVAGQLHDAVEPAYSCVRRLEGMLAIIGDGVTLTDRGYLSDTVVQRAIGALWTPREWPFPSGEELETVPVLRVRRLLQRLGLLRKYRGRLLPTTRAKGISADRMWSILVSRAVGTAYHPDTIAAEVVLADIARGSRPVDIEDLLTEMLDAEGWTHRDGPVASDTASSLADDVLADLTALGAFAYDDGHRGRSTATPSPDGIRLAAALLRHRLLHTRLPSL